MYHELVSSFMCINVKMFNAPYCVCFLTATTPTDRKTAEMILVKMSEAMQRDAVEYATQALKKYNSNLDIAKYIKEVTTIHSCTVTFSVDLTQRVYTWSQINLQVQFGSIQTLNSKWIN